MSKHFIPRFRAWDIKNNKMIYNIFPNDNEDLIFTMSSGFYDTQGNELFDGDFIVVETLNPKVEIIMCYLFFNTDQSLGDIGWMIDIREQRILDTKIHFKNWIRNKNLGFSDFDFMARSIKREGYRFVKNDLEYTINLAGVKIKQL